MKRNRNNSLFDRTLLRQSLRASFQKLDPRKMVKNPIMFTVEAVTFVMLLLIVWIAIVTAVFPLPLADAAITIPGIFILYLLRLK